MNKKCSNLNVKLLLWVYLDNLKKIFTTFSYYISLINYFR